MFSLISNSKKETKNEYDGCYFFIFNTVVITAKNLISKKLINQIPEV